MPNTIHIGIEVPPDIMEAADKIFYDWGVTIPEAVRLMISKTIKDGCPPFDIKAALNDEYGEEIPNRTTFESFDEIERGEVHHAKDIDDLFRQLRI